jgi:hypothetical protein
MIVFGRIMQRFDPNANSHARETMATLPRPDWLWKRLSFRQQPNTLVAIGANLALPAAVAALFATGCATAEDQADSIAGRLRPRIRHDAGDSLVVERPPLERLKRRLMERG